MTRDEKQQFIAAYRHYIRWSALRDQAKPLMSIAAATNFRLRNRPSHRADSPQPLRVMFIITTLEVGGAETLLVNLVRRFDRAE